MLETRNVTMQFGGLTAVSDFSIRVGDTEIVGLIGPNGAGKTTAFNTITGMYTPTRGSVIFNGTALQGKKPHLITKAGIARTFQNIRLFGSMTVLENVLTACNHEPGLFESVFRLPAYRRKERAACEKARALLDAAGILDVADENALSLPYGKQRRLEIARALATGPRLLLLDEPAAGMNGQESAELMEFITGARDRFNIAVLLIEHHMQVVMGMCERLYVLDYGVIIAQGTPAEIRANPKVIDAYLGNEGAPC